jgi:endonuclease/exonuclease/phosphatase family metal-dependent hydrolase
MSMTPATSVAARPVEGRHARLVSLGLRTSRPGSMSALVGLTTLLGIELIRVFAPAVAWQIGGRGLGPTAVAAALVAPVVGTAVVLAVALRRDPRRAMLVCGAVLAGSRLAVQGVDGTLGTVLATAGFLAALAMLALLATLGLPLFGGGLLAGVVLDAALHGALGTRALIWVDAPWATVAVGALVGWYLSLVWARTRREVFSLGRSPLAAVPLVALGPVLVVEAFMLGNFGWIGAVIGVGWLGASIVVGAAGGAGMLAAALTARHPHRAWLVPALAGGAALVALSAADAAPSRWWVPAVVLAQVGVGSSLTATVARGAGSGGRAAPLASLTLGYLVLIAALAALDGRGVLGVSLSPTIALAVAGLAVAVAAVVSMAQMGPAPHHTGRAELVSLCGVFVVPAALLVAGVPALAAAASPIGVDGDLVVVTYNVALALDAHGRLNVEEVAEVLAAIDADVVGLQEVPRGYLPTGGVDMVGWLQHSLGMPHVVFQPSAPGAMHGNAILSRHPIRATDGQPFARTGTALPRGAVAAQIELPSGDDLWFITAHLPPGGTSATRLARTDAVLALWGGRERTVVAADLNTTGSSDIVERLRDSGLTPTWDPAWGAGETFPSDAPRAQIDWVLVSDDLEVVGGARHQADASDHLAVSAVLRLPTR